jgi:hypothetical protein
MVNCHCRDCQRAGGAGSSPTVIVPAASFRLLRGEPKRYSLKCRRLEMSQTLTLELSDEVYTAICKSETEALQMLAKDYAQR